MNQSDTAQVPAQMNGTLDGGHTYGTSAPSTALLDRGYGRPAQSLDLHLSTEAITRRLSDMTDAELAALEARMITIPGSLALEHDSVVPELRSSVDNPWGRVAGLREGCLLIWHQCVCRAPTRTGIDHG